MIRHSKRAASLAIAAAGALALAGCAGGAPEAEGEGDGLKIVTTTTQVTDFVTNVTDGTGAEVTSLLQAGESAHSFEAEPADLVALGEADLVIASGYGLETWLDDTLSAAGYSGTTIHAADGFDAETLHDGAGHEAAGAGAAAPAETSGTADDTGADASGDDHDHDHGDASAEEEHADHGHDDASAEGEHADHGHDDASAEGEHADHGHDDASAEAGAAGQGDDSAAEETGHDHGDDGHDHDHGGVDPHVWSAPLGAAFMVDAITAGLEENDGANADTYRTNGDAYVQQLEGLDLWIGENVAQVPEAERLLVTNHEALSYYTDSYHVTLVGSIMPSWDDNAEPSAQELDALIAEITSTGVQAVFSETQLSSATAERIASEAGVQVYSGDEALLTDSLGAPDSETGTYIGATVHNTTQILDSWGATPTALPAELEGA